MNTDFVVPVENLFDELLEMHLFNYRAGKPKKEQAIEEKFRKLLTTEEQKSTFKEYADHMNYVNAEIISHIFKDGLLDGIRLMNEVNSYRL